MITQALAPASAAGTRPSVYLNKRTGHLVKVEQTVGLAVRLLNLTTSATTLTILPMLQRAILNRRLTLVSL